jgi:hypothetical protein
MSVANETTPRTTAVRIGVAGCLGVLILMVVGAVWFVRTATDSYRAGAKMRAVSYAIDQYATDHHGDLPTLNNLPVMEKELDDYGSEIRPSDWRPILVSTDNHEPYVLNASVSGHKMSSLKGKEPFLILYDQRPRLRKYIAAVYDGTGVYVRDLSEQKLDELKRRSGMP